MKAADPSARRQRRVWGLLIAMTVATLGGPVGIWAVLRGGESPDWPPDRAVEWASVTGICALVAALMILAVASSLANQREAARIRAASTARGEDPNLGSARID